MRNLFFLFTILSFLFISCGQEEQRADLIIYSYDSFTSEWGLGPQVIPLFEEAHGVTVESVGIGDALETLFTLENFDETDERRPDIFLGFDNNMLSRVKESGVLRPSTYKSEISFHPDVPRGNDLYHPFDFGYIAVVYDSEKISNPPRNLADLTDQRFANSFVVSDPRTSSPGLAFLYWTIIDYGDSYLDYWTNLQNSLISLPASWSTAYGMFVAGEASLVLSYTSSPAYHYEYEDKNTRYKAASFEGGHYMQVEYLGITRYAVNVELAESFLAFVHSPEFQSRVPLSNIMYPVRSDIPLPDSFKEASFLPEQKLTLGVDKDSADYWLDEWSKIMSQ